MKNVNVGALAPYLVVGAFALVSVVLMYVGLITLY